MDGETARDETRDGEERLRVFMFIPVLDELCVQMMDRFSDEQCQLLNEIALFSCMNLKKGCSIKPADIATLTSTYSLNSDAVVSEYEDSSFAFRALNVPESEMTDIPFIDDVILATPKTKEVLVKTVMKFSNQLRKSSIVS